MIFKFAASFSTFLNKSIGNLIVVVLISILFILTPPLYHIFNLMSSIFIMKYCKICQVVLL
uniref:Uncharacterized protein n=1 Tax=Dulem virus 31 TaxID=3145749 RepID=A0AAU8AU40_9VIRU